MNIEVSMSAYRLSVLQPLPGGYTLMTLLNVKVDQPIEWVRKHADEIAARAVADGAVPRHVNGGQYTALWLEAA